MSGNPGVLTISLDFELHWGSRDHRALAGDHRARVLGGRDAVARILELFDRHGIHATWATVGMMFFDSREELLAGLPERKPAYANAKLSPYEGLEEVGRDEREDPFHFAPSLIRLIQGTPGQELATHTFSHYYCLEQGQTAEAFSADLAAAREVARRKFGVEVKSLVFPRNQFNPEYVALCARAGLLTYRGNPRSWIYEPRSRASESLVHRAMRLVDSYVNLTGHHGHARVAGQANGIVDVPASRFLRPYSGKLAPLEGLRLRRIENDLSACARRGLLYHLWWHPDNFGTSQAENLRFLDQVLTHFGRLRDEGKMQSLNMAEAGRWMAQGTSAIAASGEKNAG